MTPLLQMHIDELYLTGERDGTRQRAAEANVAAAYYVAGMNATALGLLEDSDRLRIYFDGFTAGFWIDVTDKQKSGPYA